MNTCHLLLLLCWKQQVFVGPFTGSNACPVSSAARTTSALPKPCTKGCLNGFCTSKTDGNYVDPDNANQFFMCSGGLTTTTSCPAGLVYQAACNLCNYPNTPCPPPTTQPTAAADPFCKNKPGGVYCYPPDKTKFYDCSDGITSIMACPANLVWQESCSCCSWPS